MKLFHALFLLYFIPTILASNILVLQLYPFKSHTLLMEKLLVQLDARGHNITFITAFYPKKPPGRMKIIELPDLKPHLLTGIPFAEKHATLLELRDSSPMFTVLGAVLSGLNICSQVFNLEMIQDLIKSDEKFDLILGELFAGESLLAGFSHKFNAPIVGFQTTIPSSWANFLVGNPAHSSYIPHPLFEYSSNMNIFQRTFNFVFGSIEEFLFIFLYLANWQNDLMKKNFGEDLPPITSILKNTSLVLVNYHHSLFYPRPYVPNMINVLGIHIDYPKPLPLELQQYLDGSRKGAIVFSLGSHVRSADLPPELINSILKVFSRLKENVLWKFEENLSDLPRNVKVMKWIPQSDVLAHPNVKLLISHGGLMSTTEAVFRGVPIIGIPILGDQHVTMKHVEFGGFGRTLRFDDLNEHSFFETIDDVLKNPRYKQQVELKSQQLRDNPMPPLQTAVWWVEYVLRHKGAPQLRSAGQNLAIYELYLIDVFILLLITLLIMIFTISYALRSIFRKLFKCRRKRKQM